MPTQVESLLEKRIYDAVSEIAGAEVVWETQNAPRPDGVYVSLFGPRVEQEGNSEERVNDLPADLVQIERASWHLATVTITAHGVGAYNRAWSLRRRLESDGSSAKLAPLVFLDAEQVLQLPQLLEANFEERAQFDAVFRVVVADIEGAQPTIATVNPLAELYP